MRGLRRIISLILPLVLLCSVGGVFATWQYAEGQTPMNFVDCGFAMGDYQWDGSANLPNKEEANHMVLIDNLVNGPNGLNNENSPVSINLSNRVEGIFWGWASRDHYGSVDTDKTGVDDLLGDERKITFIVQIVVGAGETDTTYTKMYIYTTDVYLGEPGTTTGGLFPSNETPGKPSIALGEKIYPVYRTEATRANANADWELRESKIGSAPSAWYTESRNFTPTASQIPSFDFEEWTEETLGTRMNNAIWTFRGDEPVLSADTATEFVYYQIQPTAGVCTVTTDILETNMTILDANGAEIAVSELIYEGGVERIEVSFTAEEDELYYIRVTGATYVPIVVV